jgi:ribosomal protein S18 acetylase RimI-like enzyme
VSNLRRAVAGDALRLHEIAQAAYGPYLERMGGLRPRPLDEDYAAAVAHDEVWVAEEDGTVTGFVVLCPEEDRMLLANVAVAPSHRGRGVGRALLTLAEERALAHGLHRIHLFTHVTMVENQALYERIGYLETHRSDDAGFARVFYEKTLG